MKNLLFVCMASLLLSANCQATDKNWGLADIHLKAALTHYRPTKKHVKVVIIDTGFEGEIDGGLDGHGTHVEGIIRQVNPDALIYRLTYFRKSSPGFENRNRMVKAIKTATKMHPDIINISGGGPIYDQEEYEAIKNAGKAGILLVAAAGNEKQYTSIEENKFYPASYNLSNIISVAALGINGRLIPESNYGEQIDFAAPGENIYSTLNYGQYGYLTGTSMATAFVTGVASLVVAERPKLKPYEIKFIIAKSTKYVKELKVKYGKIDAERALVEALK